MWMIIFKPNWTEINPGQNGCFYSDQCASVWPNAHCQDGLCKCPEGYRERATRDGYVCVAEAIVGRAPPCPLPTFSITNADSDPQTVVQISTALPSPSRLLPVAFCDPNSRTAPPTVDDFDHSYNYACAAPSPGSTTEPPQSVADLYDCIIVASEYLPKSTDQLLTKQDSDKEVGICCMNRGIFIRCTVLFTHCFSICLHSVDSRRRIEEYNQFRTKMVLSL
jgi:hypothetical protein